MSEKVAKYWEIAEDSKSHREGGLQLRIMRAGNFGRQPEKNVRIVPSWFVTPIPAAVGFWLRIWTHHLNGYADSCVEIWSDDTVTDPRTCAWLCFENTRNVKGADKITPRILSLHASERNDNLARLIEIIGTNPIAM